MTTTLGIAPHDWRFYGREAEIESLKRHLCLDIDDLKQRRFRAFIVAGRRHVGKNALLMETHRLHGGDTPLLTVELPEDTNAEECLNELMSTIQNRDMSSFMHDMPERGSYCRDATRFADVVRHLVDQGIIVCLDEFHNAYRTGLESALKVIIDQIALAELGGQKRPPGQLVFMGSHQQYINRIFDYRRALNGRADVEVHLNPWSLSTVMDVADQHGWLRNVDRFLTLWSIWGGMPKNWERLATNHRYRHLRDFSIILDSNEWRHQLLKAERDFLIRSPRDRFNHRSTIELKPTLLVVLMQMSLEPRSRLLVSELASKMKETLQVSERLDKTVEELLEDLAQSGGHVRLRQLLDQLKMDLQMVRSYPNFTGKTELAWTLDDHNSHFQPRLFPDLFGQQNVRKTIPASLTEQVKTLQVMEGYMMERMAEDWLAEYPPVHFHMTGARAPGGGADVDVLAVCATSKMDAVLLAGSAKRNAAEFRRKHREKFRNDLETLMIKAGRETAEIRKIPRRLMLFAPHFTAEQRAECETDGFHCFGIAEMATDLKQDRALLKGIV